MAIDEGSRHRLFRKLDQVLGAEEATTLMGLLPPVGFDLSDLPTKNDLAAVGREIRLEFRADMERLARRLTMWTSSMMVGLAALAFAAGKFI